MAQTVEDKLDSLVARVGKVRRWLVALAILKVSALSLGFVSVYIGVYAWLDHHLNFDEVGRIISFVLLVAGVAFLLHRLTRLLLSHVSCSQAANYIENNRSFDQQLVAGIEYHENKREYLYSKALAEQLVLRVDRDSREFKFDATVQKWQGYALAAVILFCLAAVWFYVHDNYVYFSSYFARLIHPLASVEPLSGTSLESITKDVVVAPDFEVTLAAEIKGRVPEFGKLVLVEVQPTTSEVSQEPGAEEMRVRTGLDEEQTPRFEATRSFSETGEFKYRFETGSASTDWHSLSVCQPPGIESITANVTLPQRPPRRKWVKPYCEQVKDNTLRVIPGSNVGLDVNATGKLKEVVVTGPDGRQITKQLDGAEQFTFNFSAETRGSVGFHLVNEQGLVNDNVPDLEVIVKEDEPPQFKLMSPEGDYLATDVASVPIVFEVTDDFGLDSVTMYVEIPRQPLKELTIPIEEGARSRKFSDTIELERYELAVGDSILFYAEATDVDTGSALANRTSSSEVYFIEVRPYRQYWRPKAGGGRPQTAGPTVVELLNILEYTRAILKKTWAIAGKSDLTDEDRSKLEFINNDVQYCADQLALIRDDSEYGFNDRQKLVLNEVIKYYEQASQSLAARDATAAVAPEKNAYRVLRRFIIELEMELNPPQSGQGQQEQKPDSVKLQEMPEFSEYERERIEGELKELQQKLDKLTQEQTDLQKTFENFLEQQAKQKRPGKSGAERKSSSAPADKEDREGAAGEQQSQVVADKGQDTAADKGASEGQRAGKGTSRSEGEGTGDTRAPADAQARGTGKGRAANADARLRMLQAKQGAVQEQVALWKQDLLELPENSEDGKSGGRGEAQKHLDKAVERMDEFQSKLAEARYRADSDQIGASDTVELMESAKREMHLAKEALAGELMLSEEERIAQKAQEMAEQLVEDADALDESVTPVEREEMLARLEAAKRLLEMMPEPQWTTVDRSRGANLGASHVLTKNPNLAPAEAAREMARQFWSIAIDAKKRRRQLLKEEPSDVMFYGQENEFFENAAKFDRKRAQE